MERIKQAVKKRQSTLANLQRKKICINIYEAIINDLIFRIEEGLLDNITTEEKKLYFNTKKLGDFGKVLIEDYFLHEFLLEKGLPVVEVGYDETSYIDTVLATQFYIVINMLKIWRLGDE